MFKLGTTNLLENFLYLVEGNIDNPDKVSFFIPGLGANLFGSTKTGGRADVVINCYQNILPPSYASVFLELQDYDKADEQISYALTFEEQSQRFEKVSEVVLDEFQIKSINITAQSIGCHVLVAALPYLKEARLPLSNLILLGPSTFENDNFAERITGEFKNRPGTFIDLENESRMTFGDNKTIFLKKTYWESVRRNNLKNNLGNIASLFSHVVLFFAAEDKLCFNGKKYFKEILPSNCKIINIPGRSHQFRQKDMQVMLYNYMQKYYFK